MEILYWFAQKKEKWDEGMSWWVLYGMIDTLWMDDHI